jgi:stalled ribosome rescue protein Dom34
MTYVIQVLLRCTRSMILVLVPGMYTNKFARFLDATIRRGDRITEMRARATESTQSRNHQETEPMTLRLSYDASGNKPLRI